MLHTTALGLGDESTAALAKRHLDDTARLTMEITRVIPGVVLQELADDGENVTQAVRERALADARDSWHQRQPQ
jgi:hypothetical protein